MPECNTCVLGRLVFDYLFVKSIAFFLPCTGTVLHVQMPECIIKCILYLLPCAGPVQSFQIICITGMHHMCIGVPCFLLPFGKVYFLSPAMYWACSKCSNTGIHHMCIGCLVFYYLLVKCLFYHLRFTGPVLSVQIPECITCILGCLMFY